jgi:hypothetical protein
LGCPLAHAVGDGSGRANFPNFDFTTQVNSRGAAPTDSTGVRTYSVDVVRIDDVLGGRGVQFMKIDSAGC